MKYSKGYHFGFALLCCGVGVLCGLPRTDAWKLVIVGGAVMFVAFVASIVHLFRHGDEKPDVESLTVDAKETRRWLATRLQVRVVTTTMRDVETRQ